MFAGSQLGQEQKELLSIIVEAYSNASNDAQQEFLLMPSLEGTFLDHPGLPDGEVKVNVAHVEELHRLGLITLAYDSVGVGTLDVTPEGLACYNDMTEESGKSVQSILYEIRSYLDAEFFQMTYPFAYKKWEQAERKLWESVSQTEFRGIGKLCREALEEFAADMTQIYRPPNYDQNKTHTFARIKAVLDFRSGDFSASEKAFLDTLLQYWRAVSDLILDQEQGGAQTEKKQLTWEDARRVVFQTAIVMFEVSHSLEPRQS